ncbi:MAG: hypothetical protein HY292_19820 [Planctomycetes bacterium]|nr:hypothetical protein [Planctomycetota bacterium]
MTRHPVRCIAIGAGLCITAGLLSLPVVAQSTGSAAHPMTPKAALDRIFEGADVVNGNDPSVFKVVKVGDSQHPMTREQIRRQVAGGPDLTPAQLESKVAALRTHDVDVEEKLRLDHQLPPAGKAQPGDETNGPILGVTPPTNDACATPTIAGLGSFPFDNTCATAQASDPTYPCGGGGTPFNSLWFQFTPASSGTYQIDCCGSTYDTLLGVWTGPACGPYVNVACNDDFCGLQSSLSTALTSGTTYRIEVDGFSGATGTGTLNISLPTPPGNDTCAAATVLPGAGPFPVTGTEGTTLATTDVTDPLQACTFGGAAQNSNSVWFSWTPTAGCLAGFETCTSGYDTVLSVFTGTCAAIGTEIACNDDGGSPNCGGTLQSGVTWTATASTTYLIEVTDFATPGGGTLNWRLDCGTGPTPPPNDECANATALPPAGPFPITCSQTTNTGTTNVTDPAQACTFGGPNANSHSVWFTWTPAQSASILLNTCGSDYDTVASVFTGACGSLTEIACDDDSGAAGPCAGTLQSFLTFNAIAGVTYTIEITSFANSPGGNLQKSLGPCVPSACDAPPIDEDAWTTTAQCLADSAPGLGECGLPDAEVYTFPVDANPGAVDPEDLVVVDKIKVPSCGLPNGVMIDYFFVRRNPLCPPGAPVTGEDICLPVSPARAPRLILNDVFYSGSLFPPSTNGKPYETTVALMFNSAHARLGTGDFDYFKVVEFDPGVCPDVDGDTQPDCGVQLRPETGTGVRFNLSGTLDVFGAEVIEFFVNRNRHNLNCLNVFEEHPSQPPARAAFPGNQAGEDAETRPWSFHVD